MEYIRYIPYPSLQIRMSQDIRFSQYADTNSFFTNIDTEPEPEPEPEPRRSSRLHGSKPTKIHLNECLGKTCIITRERIKGYGIRLSDGQYYSADAITRWYHTNNTTPYRIPFTEKDIEKIREWEAFQKN
jgi:hypothetical protein